MHWLIKLLTASTIAIFLWRAIPSWQTHPTITLSLVIFGELLTLTIYLVSRPATQSTMGFIPLASTLFGTFFFFFISLGDGIALAPLQLTVSLQFLGVLWQIFAKASLGRSFGLLPANRGIVTHGAYRLVRHPIYLGYALAHLGFLLAAFSWRNLGLFAALYFFQGVRIWQEEKVLKTDLSYVLYSQRTRFRFIPGLF